MAKKVFEEVIDDLDGSPAAHTVRIGWDNEWREIDLSDKNLTSLSKGFDRFWDVGRPVTGSTKATRTRRARRSNGAARPTNGSGSYDREQFRAWARGNGIKLSRGRPPRDLIDRFLASQ